jgi:hypothetical protein
VRTYQISPTIEVPDVAIAELGWLKDEKTIRRFNRAQTVLAPKIALSNLGDASQLITAGASVGGKVAGSAVTSAATSAGWGAAAGPIGAAVAVAIGVIAGLIAAHEQRVHDATNENSAAETCVSSFYNVIRQIVSALNAGQLAPSDAITQLQALDQATYTALRSHVGTPGTAWGDTNFATGICNSSCTVGCCLYNTYLRPNIYGSPDGVVTGLITVIQNGGGTWTGGGILANKYGLPATPNFSLTVNPPAPASVSGEVSGALTSVEQAIGGGSAGGVLPLLLLGVAAFLLLR